MIAGVLYDWRTAARAARAGHFVRRRGWTTKWLRWWGGLWFLRETGSAERVVRAADFGRDEFLAGDWTHQPPECIVEAQRQTGTTCPVPFIPRDPGTVPQDLAGGAGGAGGNGNVLSGGFAGGAVDEGEPPPPGSIGTAGTGGGTGGVGTGWVGTGGSGGGGGGPRPPRPPRDSLVWPSLSFGTITDYTFGAAGQCYPNDGAGGAQSASFGGPISLSNPMNVVQGIYFVTVRNAGRIIWTTTMSPGDSADWFSSFTGLPGASSFGLEARAWGPRNAPDIVANATTPSMKCYCDASGGSLGEP